MKRLGVLLLVALVPAALARDVRTWTSASGKTIEAAFVERNNAEVVLQRSDGEKMAIRLDLLSNADRAYVGGRENTGAAGVLPGSRRPTAKAPVPPELEALFGRHLVNATGKKVSTAELAGKRIGIYFSSSGCPGCRSFTPRLVASYNQRKAEGQSFEVVLVAGEIDEYHVKAYMQDYHMPWLAVPFGDEHIQILQKKFGVAFIPKFVEIDAPAPALPAAAGNGGAVRDAPSGVR